MADETENQEGQDDVDQDAMLAEWEAMAEGGDDEGEDDGADGLGSTRGRDQNGIDSLLGGGNAERQEGDRAGMRGARSRGGGAWGVGGALLVVTSASVGGRRGGRGPA